MKALITIGAFIGSSVGGAIPMLWGSSYFSFTSLFLGFVGGLVGIWAAYRLSVG